LFQNLRDLAFAVFAGISCKTPFGFIVKGSTFQCFGFGGVLPFDSIEHAQIEVTQWLWCYNRHRPHMALGGKTPFQARSLSKIDSRTTH
jgi:transposase InsO family protein